MNSFLQEILFILTNAPSSLIYHLVLTFSVASALPAALNHWRASQFPQGRRTVLGLSLMLVIRLAMFVLAGFAWQGLINEHILMPPVDRAATLVSLIIIIWMWGFPEPLRPADAAMWIVAMLGLTGLVLNLVWWTSQGGGIDYNGSWPDFIGEVVTMVIIIAGGLVLVVRKPNGWGFGIGMLLLALAGHAAYLMLPTPNGDFAGVVRLAQMAYFPLLLTIPQRFPMPTQQAPSQTAPPERKRLATDPKLLESYIALGSESDPGKICQAITRSIAGAILADVCLLLTPPDEHGEMTIQCGYDLIREDSLDGSILSARGAPLIATALSRGLPLRLPASSTSEDLRTLGANLHLERPGHLLVAPVVNSDEKPIAGILLLSPYSNRAWSGEDQTIVSNLSASMAQLLQRTQAQASFQMGLSQAQQALQILEGEVQELRNENESMRNRLQTAQEQSEKNRVQAEALAALVAAQGESGQVQQKKAVQPDAPRLNTPQETDYLEGEMRLALEEVARLKAALQDADQRYLTLKGQLDGEAPSDEDYEEIATIVQELRQPMSSVIGYTDFLLGESVGILGALQRKFLERIKISTERINRLINELVRLTAAEMDGGKQLMPEGIDLYTAVEGAIAESIDRLREKDIALRVDVPEQLPPVSADEDAVKQVLINLIENAREITPANGEINLRASLQSGEQPQDYVLVQISDQGGGIPPEYMPRVFSRFGYANGKPIPGTGGKSSHLSVVKMLVENCGGRIWVDSLPPTGSTFSILLPVASETLERDDPGGLAV